MRRNIFFDAVRNFPEISRVVHDILPLRIPEIKLFVNQEQFDIVTTLPSKKICIVDIPEVESIEAKFVYNFFKRDEEINENEKFTNTKDTPRYIVLNWKQVIAGSKNDLIFKSKNEQVIKKSLDKILDEAQINHNDFIKTIIYRRDNVWIFNNILKLYDELTNAQNPGINPVITKQNVFQNSSDRVGKIFYRNLIIPFNSYFFDLLNTKKSFRRRLEKKDLYLEKCDLEINIDKKFIFTLFNTVRENILYGVNDAYALSRITRFLDIQLNAQSQNSSSIFDKRDYDIEIEGFIDFYKVDDSKSFDSYIQTIGYVIRKSEVLEDGRLEFKENIIIDDPNVGIYYDPKVRYGAKYIYEIRTIAIAETLVQDIETSEFYAIRLLISSKETASNICHCIETVPPPVIQDWFVKYNHITKKVTIFWSLPANPQRDIKYIRVFKRKSIDEPFRLFTSIDFNDSLTPRKLPEELLINEKNLKLKFIKGYIGFVTDDEFDGTPTIYALSTIDAHGYTSNYSMQLMVWFSEAENHLHKKLISVSGAPMQYPNFYLPGYGFLDSIKVSNKKKMNIIFTPDCLTLGNKKEILYSLENKKRSFIFQLNEINTLTNKNIIIKIE